jgi:hypothetical protein
MSSKMWSIGANAVSILREDVTPTTLSDSYILSGLGALKELNGISTPKPTQQSVPLTPLLHARPTPKSAKCFLDIMRGAD